MRNNNYAVVIEYTTAGKTVRKSYTNYIRAVRGAYKVANKLGVAVKVLPPDGPEKVVYGD